MDEEVKDILRDIIGLLESLDLDHHPYPFFDDYKLKIDKEKILKLKTKLSL